MPPSDLGRLENAYQDLQEVAGRSQALANQLSQYNQTLITLPERMLHLLDGSSTGVAKQVAHDYMAARAAVAAAVTALAQARGLAMAAAGEAKRVRDKERRR